MIRCLKSIIISIIVISIITTSLIAQTNYSLSFAGGWVELTDIDLSNSLTVEAWIKISNFSSPAMDIISKHFDGTDVNYLLRVYPSEILGFEITINGQWYQLQGQTTLQLNHWYHAAASYDGSEVILFLNGTIENTLTVAGTVATNDLVTSIGRYAGGTDHLNYYYGLIDEVRISDISRYTTTFTPTYGEFSVDANTIAIYYFNEGTGTAVTDESGNGNNGTIYGGATWNTDVPLPPSDLIAYYPFNGNANDESGNGNDGTVHGATLTTDRFGNTNSAYSFDGVDDFIIIPHSASLNIEDELTISYWVVLETSAPYYYPYHIIEKYNSWSSGQRNWDVQFGLVSGDSSYHTWSTGLSPSTYYLVTLTYDGSTISRYLNDARVDSVSITGSISLTNSDVLIGKHAQGEGYYFDGTVDDIRIYNCVLSANQVDSLYHLNDWNEDTTDGLIAYYPFNGNAYDESGNGNDGAVNGANLTTDRFGDVNSAYSFDGIDDYIEVTDRIQLTEAACFSLWIKPDSLKPSGIISKRVFSFDHPANDDWQLSCHENEGVFAAYLWGTSNEVHFTNTGFLTSGNWIHIVVTYDGYQNKIYKNGVLVDTMSNTGNINEHDFDLLMGDDWSSNHFDGIIDDIRIYNSVLTEIEIDSLYHFGGWDTHVDEGLVAHYPFNGNADDESGNENDGTVNGATLTNDRFGNANSAYEFDGVDDYIDCGHSTSLDITGDISVNIWLKTSTTTGNILMSKVTFNSSSNADDPWALSINPNKGTLSIRDDSNLGQLTSNRTINDGNWHMLTGVNDTWSSTMSIYVDGILDTSGTGLSYISSVSSPVFIGSGYQQGGGGYVFLQGVFDDARIYNRAITSQEIDSLYHVGGWRDYETGTVTDIDDNTYQTVKIGDQWWVAENLKVTHYRNGDTIPNIQDDADWENMISGAVCYYDNDNNSADSLGSLYNWYAVNDARNIAPEGWHVPTDDEWAELEMFLGMSQEDTELEGWRGTDEGTKLKSTTGWDNNGNGTDEYGFKALPVGYRYFSGEFMVLGQQTYIWTATENPIDGAWRRALYNNNSGIYRSGQRKHYGFSIRCVRDSQIAVNIGTGEVYANDTLLIPVNVVFSINDTYQAAELNFDGYQSGLDFIGIDTAGTMFGGTDWIYSINETDTLMFTAYAGTDNISGSGVFCYLKFVATGDICSTVPVECVYAKFNSTETDDITSGEVYIKPVPVYGDVDENTLIEALDASKVLQHVISIDTLDCQGLANADVTNDGTISALDASVILQYVVHLIDTLPHTQPLLAEGNMGFLDDIIYPGTTIDIPINLTGGNNILSFEGELSFNPDHLSFVSVDWSTLLTGFSIQTVESSGSIAFAGASANPDGQEGVFATVHFTVNNSFAENETQISLNNIRLNEGDITSDMATATLVLTADPGEVNLPSQFTLHQNYPNPFNPTTQLRYDLPEQAFVQLAIYDLLGRQVTILANQVEDPGFRSVTWNGTDAMGKTVSAGMYLYVIKAGDFVQTRKMILLK